jgi:hypothetical protein
LGQRPAAHVVGEQRAREHRGIGAEQLVDRGDDRAQDLGEHRGQRVDADHGEREGAHGVEALLELLAQPELVSDRPVETAQDHADHQNPDDYVVDTHVTIPLSAEKDLSRASSLA